jgi:hypothetical protein
VSPPKLSSSRSPAADGLPRRVAREAKVHTQAYLGLRRARRATRGSMLIVGPWASEVGFELLYWIPFVRHLLRERGVPPDRVVVVSRGGVSGWYGGMTAHYIDLLDWLSVERLLEEHKHRIREIGVEKQLSLTALEREVVARVRERFGEPRARVLHPSTMYRRYRAVWMRRRAPTVVEREVDFSPIRARPSPPAGLEVGGYIAVKAYFSGSFPPTAENRAALRGLLERLAGHAPVVLLESGGWLDDHEHPELLGIDGIVPISRPAPQTNLGEQTSIVRGARLLVATYGGFSYLGPFLGVPTCALYSSDTFNRAHLDVLRKAERELDAASDRSSGPGYLIFDIRQLPLIDQLAAEPAGAGAPPG